MRLRVRRRKTICVIIKLLVAAFIILSIYYLTKSESDKFIVKTTQEPSLKLFIIENENDAIPLWRNLSHLSLSSGTLISISSHFSVGFRMQPESKKKNYISYNELTSDISQVNFQTISLALSGKFQKVIWIYPMWKSDNNIFTQRNQILGVNKDNICLCRFHINNSLSNETFCDNLFPSFSSPIEEDSCQLLTDKWEILTMQEIYALVGLKEISVSTPVVVNINLDFFTVEKDKAFVIDREIRQKIEMSLSSIFCIKDVSNELAIDRWFQKLIKYLKMKDVFQLIKITDVPVQFLCQSQMSRVQQEIRILIDELRKVQTNVLNKLSQMGICVRENSDNYQSEKDLQLQICAGYMNDNYTNPQALHTHTGIDAEYQLQIEKVVKILQLNVEKPSIISIIRSSRLGIVSSRNQNFIEKQLVSQLQSIYKLQPADIVYGDTLLGGADGWWLRHDKRYSNKNVT